MQISKICAQRKVSFYKKYFPEHKDFDYRRLRQDFDFLNEKLLKNYRVQKIPEAAKKYAGFYEGETILYHYDKITKFIREMSEIDLHQVAEEILEKKDYQYLLK